MRRSLVLPAAATLLTLMACGEKKPQPLPVTTTQTKGAPAWIDNEEIPDGLAAVGIASQNISKDKAMQRADALLNARSNMAAKLKARVQNMFSQLTQRVNTASSTEKKPIQAEVMQRVQENVTRQLVDQTLAGSAPRDFWTDPSDGNLYVLVVISKGSLEKAMASNAQEQLRKEIAQGEKALEAALDKLDAAIAASSN